MNLRGLLTAAVVVVGVTVAAPTTTASASPCAYAPTFSGVTVAVVVDFGDGSPASAVCVPADSSDNGAAVLAARARQLGTPAPRFDSSGFVCGIDGYPSSGCGEQTGGTYAYWSYWHGTGDGGWLYSNVGPGGSRVHGDVVEGWRFQPQGAGNPSDPPPNGSPDHNATCVPATTTTATTTPTADTSPPATNAAVAPDPSASATATSVPTPASASTTTTTSSSNAIASSSSSPSSQVAAPVRVTEQQAGGSSPWPAVGAGVVIAGLIGGGLFAARRRGVDPP